MYFYFESKHTLYLCKFDVRYPIMFPIILGASEQSLTMKLSMFNFLF